MQIGKGHSPSSVLWHCYWKLTHWRQFLSTAATSPRQQHRYTHMLVSHRNLNFIATTFQCKTLLHKEPLVTLYPHKCVNVDSVPFSLKFCSLVNKVACLYFCCLKATCHALNRTIHFWNITVDGIQCLFHITESWKEILYNEWKKSNSVQLILWPQSSGMECYVVWSTITTYQTTQHHIPE